METRTTTTRRLDQLKEHPLNSHLYNEPLREELVDLCQSIADNGLLEPLIVNKENVILSGHRRRKALLLMGREEVDVFISESENEELTIIEANRYRRKTVTEIMREAEKLMEIESKNARDRTRFGQPTGEVTREKVARALGIGSGYQLDKLRKVWEAAKNNPNVAEKLRMVDEGKTSVHAVFKSLSPAGKEDMTGQGLDIQIYSLWYFLQPDPGLGIPHPGRIAGQTVQNVLWYYTQPGDLVVDPFAGGGVTIDACEILGRSCIAYDIAPVRDDIIPWDITQGYPGGLVMSLAKEEGQPQLIFADPPYWNMLQAEYNELSEGSVSNLDLKGFTEFLFKFAKDSFGILRSGGYLAIITMPQTYKLPEGVPFMDWPFECRLAMDEAGFVPYRRIVNRWPTSIWNAHQVEQSKDSKHLLQVTGDIIVGKKP